MSENDGHGRRTLQQYLPLVRLAFLAVTAVSMTALAINALDVSWKVGAAIAVGLYLLVIAYLYGKMRGAQEGYTEAKIEQWGETPNDKE